MKKRDIRIEEWKSIHRWTLVFIGLLLLAIGGMNLLAKRTHYETFWGAPVFTPFAVVVGLLALVGAARIWIKKN